MTGLSQHFQDLRSAQFGTGVSEPRNKRGWMFPSVFTAKKAGIDANNPPKYGSMKILIHFGIGETH